MSRHLPRNFRVLDKTRLLSASVGALLAHGLLFAAAWWMIESLSLPSHTNRLIVLTLDSSPVDGSQSDAVEAESTLNDVASGEPREASDADLLPLPDRSSESARATEHAPMRAELESRDPLTQPVEVAEQALEPDPAPSSELAKNGEAAAPQMSAVTGDLRSELIEELQLLTGIGGELMVNASSSAHRGQSVPSAQISDAQRKMFERKVREWSTDIDQLEGELQPLTWRHKGQEYEAVFRRSDTGGETDLEEIVVQISTREDGKQLTTQLQMQRLAFSSFAQFVHRWDPTVTLHNDSLNGRFHSNSQINVDYAPDVQPVFHGKVTTTSHRVHIASNRGRATRKKIFLGGLVTGVKRIDMPKPRDLYAHDDDAQKARHINLTEDGALEFVADGSWRWQATEGDQVLSGDTHSAPIYFLADRKVDLSLRGDVLGQVLVYSRGSISIAGSLRYAQGQDADSYGENLLGIVSDRDIRIAAPEITGPGDIEITAAVYARRRFKVDQYRQDKKGTLTIVGSLSAGSLDATEPRYATRIVFDKRLERMRPPGFPVTSEFEMRESQSGWQGVPLSRFELPAGELQQSN